VIGRYSEIAADIPRINHIGVESGPMSILIRGNFGLCKTKQILFNCD